MKNNWGRNRRRNQLGRIRYKHSLLDDRSISRAEWWFVFSRARDYFRRLFFWWRRRVPAVPRLVAKIGLGTMISWLILPAGWNYFFAPTCGTLLALTVFKKA
jgi:hypothetical protein